MSNRYFSALLLLVIVRVAVSALGLGQLVILQPAALELLGEDIESMASLAHAYGLAGRRAEARELRATSPCKVSTSLNSRS